MNQQLLEELQTAIEDGDFTSDDADELIGMLNANFGAEELIRIVFTVDDVASILDDNDEDADPVDLDEAMDRAREWGEHIEATATNLCNEQLASVIRYGTP